MGICYAKPQDHPQPQPSTNVDTPKPHPSPSPLPSPSPSSSSKPWASPFFPFYSPSPLFHKKSPSHSSTPRRFFKMPPSPARHIRAALARRQGSVKPNTAIAEEGEETEETPSGLLLDKRFGFCKGFEKQFEMGEEVGRGHFGFTCLAKFRRGELKGEKVAVKVIPKAKVQQR